mmetsp:Transcript_9006/g.23299  ORF Transcript_9006/g.23299 Transcript_9006/m.23299 type:complete len:248 (+) Transcript_9006:365-1108(+)
MSTCSGGAACIAAREISAAACAVLPMPSKSRSHSFLSTVSTICWACEQATGDAFAPVASLSKGSSAPSRGRVLSCEDCPLTRGLGSTRFANLGGKLVGHARGTRPSGFSRCGIGKCCRPAASCRPSRGNEELLRPGEPLRPPPLGPGESLRAPPRGPGPGESLRGGESLRPPRGPGPSGSLLFLGVGGSEDCSRPASWPVGRTLSGGGERCRMRASRSAILRAYCSSSLRSSCNFSSSQQYSVSLNM